MEVIVAHDARRQYAVNEYNTQFDNEVWDNTQFPCMTQLRRRQIESVSSNIILSAPELPSVLTLHAFAASFDVEVEGDVGTNPPCGRTLGEWEVLASPTVESPVCSTRSCSPRFSALPYSSLTPNTTQHREGDDSLVCYANTRPSSSRRMRCE